MDIEKVEGWQRHFFELLWIFTEVIGYGGVGLIGYTALATYMPTFHSPGVDAVTPFLSSLATILGTLFLAGTVYLPASARPAWPHSRHYIAWVVIAGCILALYFLLSSHMLPPPVTTGFGLLAISGSIKRLIPGDVPRPPK